MRNAGRTAETIEKSRRLSLAAQLLAQLLIFHVGFLQRSVSGFQVTLELIDQLDELPLGPVGEPDEVGVVSEARVLSAPTLEAATASRRDQAHTEVSLHSAKMSSKQ